MTVRRGATVEHRRLATLAEALDHMESAAREAARTQRPAPVDLRFRRFERSERVAARVELVGPGRFAPAVRAGVDVHGDGSMIAHLGRARRTAIVPQDDETALQALRRLVG